MKNNILAVLGGTVALFGLGYLIYVVLFAGSTFHFGSGSENVLLNPDDVNFGAIIFMEVLYAALLTLIYGKWAQIKTFSTGAKAGFLIGALSGACFILHLYATTNLTSINGVLFYTATFAVRFAVAGGVVAWILGRD